MYIPQRYREDDFENMKNLMVEFPLATIIVPCNSNHGVEVAHIPLFWEQADDDDQPLGYLIGHTFKGNPIVNTVATHGNWVVIFQDTGCYISPNWYPNKQDVPTWNYRAVHCTVEASLTNDYDDLLYMTGKLADIQEGYLPNQQFAPWSFDAVSDEYVNKLSKAIVGFRLKIIDIQAHFKLSQDDDEITRKSIIHHLKSVNTYASLSMAENIQVAD